MAVITRHKYATAHNNAAYLRQIGAINYDFNATTNNIILFAVLFQKMESQDYSIRK
jgi:hypothetical protein